MIFKLGRKPECSQRSGMAPPYFPRIPCSRLVQSANTAGKVTVRRSAAVQRKDCAEFGVTIARD